MFFTNNLFRRWRLGAPVLCALLAGPAIFAAQPTPANIDALAEKLRADYRIPGLAIGVIAEGKILHARGYGLREVGTDAPVDGDTLFKIASNTKSFTAAALALLVDEGKLQWTDKVQKCIPEFALYDDWVSREFTVRDLLVHNSGLGPGAGDLMLWPEPNHFTRDDVIKGLKYLPKYYDFRAQYAYDNLLYIVAGEVVARISGQSWEQFVATRIFKPLKLQRCHADGFSRDTIGNLAQPHTETGGRIEVVRREPEQIPGSTMAAAGGIRCSVKDVLRWLQLQLQKGRIDDNTRLFSEKQHAAMWTGYTIMGMSEELRRWDRSHFNLYGLGWRLTDMDGELKVHHTGSLAGMYSTTALLPERNAAVVVLMNLDNSEARNLVMRALLKMFTDPDNAAIWPEKMQAEWQARRSNSNGNSNGSPTSAVKPAAAPAAQFDASVWLGRWRDPWFGDVLIRKTDTGIEFHAEKSPRLTGQLLGLPDGRARVRWLDRTLEADADLSLEPAPACAKGDPARMRMAPSEDATDFSYDFKDLRFTKVE